MVTNNPISSFGHMVNSAVFICEPFLFQPKNSQGSKGSGLRHLGVLEARRGDGDVQVACGRVGKDLDVDGLV